MKDAISALQQTASWDDFDVVKTTLESNSVAAENITRGICQVYDRVIFTTPPILLQGMHDQERGVSKFQFFFTGELSILDHGVNQAKGISAALKSLARDHAFTHHFLSPVWNWIDATRWPHFDPTEICPNSENTATQVGSTIDAMLIDVQEVLKATTQNEPTGDPTIEDRFLTRGLSRVIKCTQSLNLGGMTTHLQRLLTVLSTTPRHELPNAIGYILPFLERYLMFVDSQLINHQHWTNALFKLTYVSCSILRRICNDGFCQPPPEGEGQEGEGKESTDGVGMGEGTGTENVSEEIKDESQVEGLQDAREEGNAEREKDGNDEAIEMSEDFAGELEGVEGPDEGEEEDGSGNESEVEDKADNLDANEPRAVDEKLWGDQQGKEPRDSDDRLKGDHSSEQQQGNPEVMANENREEDKGEKEGENHAAATESDIPEDAPGADEEQPGKQGAPIEDWIDEKETLNLLEDLQMGEEEAREEDTDDAINEGNEGDLVDEEVTSQDPFPGQEDVPVSEDAPQEHEPSTSQAFQPGGTDVEEPNSNEKPDLTNPDLHGGADQDHDGMAEPRADTVREDGQTREGNKRTRGGQTGEGDEEWMVPDA